jgi:hypothetical protein
MGLDFYDGRLSAPRAALNSLASCPHDADPRLCRATSLTRESSCTPAGLFCAIRTDKSICITLSSRLLLLSIGENR